MTESRKIILSAQTDRELMPFFWISLVWGVVGFALSRVLSGSGDFAFLGVWLLVLVDLAALANAVFHLLELASATGEKRLAHLIQASTWAAIKLVCLGLFGWVLLKGVFVPVSSLLIGLATLVVVPLGGGFWWSQRKLRHA